jgi:hypothetical protein
VEQVLLTLLEHLLAMVGGSFRVLRLLPPPKPGRHDIAEILLKVALNTKNQSLNQSLTLTTSGG